MTANLNLIKSNNPEVEKRVFPRFPFTYMTFKDVESELKKVYEVVDISLTGMQLSLKNGGHEHVKGTKIHGFLHWRGSELELVGEVVWTSASRVGVAFTQRGLREQIQAFMSIENVVKGMKPLHNNELGLEIPSSLKYWLRADGPFELFLWQHNDGELSKFQVIMMNRFIEWEDGKGVRSGNVLKRRDIDSPLICSDEFLFEIDDETSEDKVNQALDLVQHIPESYLPQLALEFLTVKLGGNPAVHTM